MNVEQEYASHSTDFAKLRTKMNQIKEKEIRNHISINRFIFKNMVLIKILNNVIRLQKKHFFRIFFTKAC